MKSRTFSTKRYSYVADLNIMDKYLHDNIDDEDSLLLCIIRGLGLKDTELRVPGFKESIRNFIRNFYNKNK